MIPKVKNVKYKVRINSKLQTSIGKLSLLKASSLFLVISAILFLSVPEANAELVKSKNFSSFKPSRLFSYSAAVIDDSSGTLLFGKRENEEKPVASITKIVGAYVFLEENPSLNKKASMQQGDEVGGGRLRLPVGTTLRVKNFLYSSLIGSANNSATALVRLSGLSKNNFFDKMNNLADEAGAEKAKFVDACGISPDNRANAKDLANIGKKVFSNSQISDISSRKKYSFSINNGRGNKTITHTSPIVSYKSSAFRIEAAKTGYLPEVGNNLIVKFGSKKNKKVKIIVALIGAKTSGSTTKDAVALAKWAFDNYEWK